MYELKEYLNAINSSKERLMDGEDEMWEKKYPAIIFDQEREAGDQILEIENLSAHTDNGEILFEKLNLKVNKGVSSTIADFFTVGFLLLENIKQNL